MPFAYCSSWNVVWILPSQSSVFVQMSQGSVTFISFNDVFTWFSRIKFFVIVTQLHHNSVGFDVWAPNLGTISNRLCCLRISDSRNARSIFQYSYCFSDLQINLFRYAVGKWPNYVDGGPFLRRVSSRFSTYCLPLLHLLLPWKREKWRSWNPIFL